MDNLFKIRVLTTAVNAMRPASQVVFNRLFAGRAHLEPTDLLAFDIISGSEKLLNNISIHAPAEVTAKTDRRTITMKAPRLATKRIIHTSELNSLRAYGTQMQTEFMQGRIAREQLDMRGMIDRTLEHWACGALKGKIYDADLTTVLVDYGLPTGHKPTLSGDSLWTNDNSDPVTKIRELKLLIEDDAGAAITGWLAYLGSGVMDALLGHAKVRELMRATMGADMTRSGRIQTMSEVELQEYNASFLDAKGKRRRFIDSNEFLLIGLCDDLVDCPFAPIVDDDAPGGVGNVGGDGRGAMFFSKSWKEDDPSGRWIKVEARPLPALQRPGAVVCAKVI